MPILNEKDAILVRDTFDLLSDEEKPRASEWMQKYEAQQNDLGEPLFPSQVQAMSQNREAVRNMFGGLDKVKAEISPWSEDPNRDRAVHANMALLSDRYGKKPQEIADRYEFYLNDYAAQKFGMTQGVDDLTFYASAAKEIQREKQKEDTEIEGQKAALRGDDVIPALQAWQAKNLDRMPDSTEFTRGFLQARERSGDQLEFADTLLKQIESNTGLTKGEGATRPAPASRETAAQFEESLATLAAMKPKDRKQVYAIIGAKAESAGYDQKGFWAQMLSELGKGTARMGSTVTTQMGVTGDVLANLPGMLSNTMTEGEFDVTEASIARRQGIGEMYDEVARIVAGEVDLVRPVISWMNDTVETGLIKGPGAVAPFMMASAALGPFGAGALFTADFAEQNRRELRASGMDNAQAVAVGAAAAPLQAVVESLSNALQLGRFPAVQRVLSNFTKPIGGGSGLAVRYLQNAGLSLATEFTEEQLQDNFIVPATQELFGALESDMPQVDWSMYRNRAIESTPELLSILAPMALVFGGTMTSAQANLSSAAISSQDMLEAAGYSAAQANEVRIQPTEEAKISKAREFWGARAGTPQTIETAAKTVGERMRMLQGDAIAAQKDLESRGILPRMLRASESAWKLTFNDGSTADFNSHREADAARWQWATDQLGKVHLATRSALAQLESGAAVGREFAVEFKPDVMTAQMAVDEGRVDPAQIQRRVQQGAAVGESAAEPVNETETFDNAVATDKATSDYLASLQILGSSSNEFKNGVLRTTIRLYEGANVLTLVEEKLEGDAKQIIASKPGREWMLAKLREYERVSGDSLFRKVTDDSELQNDDLIEAWSSLGQSYLVGKSKKGAAIGKGGARRIFADVLKSGMAGAMNSETQFFNAVWRRAAKLSKLKREGKLGDDLTEELERQLGIDSQAKFENESAAEAEAIANEALNAGGASYSEENPGPNGETFALSRAVPADVSQQTVMPDGARLVGPTTFSIRAYHGTPHKVDRFRLANIGTGEGAQVYGWGLYFAQSRKVAQSYQKGLTERDFIRKVREVFSEFDSSNEAIEALKEIEMSDGQRQLIEALRNEDWWGFDYPHQAVQAALREPENFDPSPEVLKALDSFGQLYTVELLPDEADFLDWDKPLSEQSEKIRDAASELMAVLATTTREKLLALEEKQRGEAVRLGFNRSPIDMDKAIEMQLEEANASGAGFYKLVKGVQGKATPDEASEAASQYLASLGIPGIRYLDGGSRGTGEGTSNYVIFDENLVKILEENGKPVAQETFSLRSASSADARFRFDGIAKEDPINDGSRVGTAWQGKVKPTTQNTNNGIATVTPKGLKKQMGMLTQFIDGVPLPKYITDLTDPTERMRAFIAFQKGNLLALYDAFEKLSPDYVVRSTHWYDGARLLAERIRDSYGLTVEQSSAIIAVFSPMKDWFQNVAMGQRFADIMANYKKTVITKNGMRVAVDEMVNAAENGKYLGDALKLIEGRTIANLLTDKSEGGRKLAAVAVRLLSTHVHGLTHDVLTPEGESMGVRKNLDGSNKKMVWQSYAFIVKAISIYENGSLENISKTLGTEHKIRNFYNNIISPTSPFGDATVDTHAVNAAVLFPMGGSAYLTTLNFGDAGMAGGGNSGLYWLFHEALREAAAERGVLPRQMQSITWEAIRGLFPDTMKRNKKFVAKIVEIWESSPNAESARSRILELGITAPEWARVDSSGVGSEAGMAGNLGQAIDSEGSVRSGVRQGRKSGASSANVGGTFSIRSVSPAQDAEYMTAVEAGDMETAQRMVDEAAKNAGYNVGPVWHGTKKWPFNSFKLPEIDDGTVDSLSYRFTLEDRTNAILSGADIIPADTAPLGLWFTARKGIAEGFAGVVDKAIADAFRAAGLPYGESKVVSAFLKLKRPKVYPTLQELLDDLAIFKNPLLLRKQLAESGHDGIVISESITDADYVGGDLTPRKDFVAFNSNQIKSADPVTRDESGNVIPLSQRFNPADNRMTYSIRSGDFASRMSAAFSPFQRNPELRLAIAQVAKARAMKLGAEWIENASVIRSAGDIGKEARMREALAYETRMNDYLDGLTEAGWLNLKFEPASLADDPLISAMLDHGKLMSRSTAIKNGVQNMDEYEGAPWLPPAWYSKGAGITPGKMAKALHEGANGMGGPLTAGDSAADLWDALAIAIESTRKNKAAHREAVTAYKAAQKYARDASRAEADQWAEGAKKKAGSPKAQRDMLKAALRTLDGILAAAPPEVRAKVGGYVKLAGLATDEAMLQEIERRIEKLNVELEKYLKKEGIEQIQKLFKKARPDSEAGKKDKGKNADMHALFAAAERAAKMDEVAVAGELARLDSLIGGDTLTPEQEALAITERGIVELVGDLKNADAGRVFSALDTLRDIYEGGWIKWKLAQIEKREERAGMRAAFIADTGKSGVKPERDAAEREAETLLGKIKGGFLSLSSFHEVLSYAFGSTSARVKSLVDAEREASGQYEDVNQALADEVQDLFTTLAGGKVLDGEKLRFDMAQRTIQTAKGELSQLGAIQALLMWRQEDGRRHMEGQLGEDGKPISSWSYNQAWIDEITAQLTPEARSVMAWIMQKYGAEHAVLNPLYRQRYGVNMPAHDNYAPITVQPVQAKAGEVIDPVSGASMSSGSILTPGSLRTRSRNAIAEPEFRDALQTLLMHTRQLEYWKAYYDLALESSAILGNREVLNAVKAKGGEQAATALRKWTDAIAQGGFRDASASLEMNKMLQRMTGRAASVGLLGRFSTLLVQSTQLAAASVKMPLGSYLVGISKLLTGNLGYRDAINSPFIQRRYKSAPPIVRQAMEGLAAASRPNQIKRATRALGQLLSGTDALFTAGTYALLLDYHRGTGRALGLTGADLEEHAHTEAQRDTEQVAQPTRMAARSLAEVTSTNPLAKVSWAYASEARQKIALMAWAATKAKSEPAQFAKTAFLVFGVGGLLTQVLKGLWREAKGDDDEKKWSAERLTLAALTGPLHGVPLASELMGDQGMLSGVAWAWPALKDIASGEGDMRDVDTLLSTLGLFNDTAAAAASLSHAGLDAAKVIQNLADKK